MAVKLEALQERLLFLFDNNGDNNHARRPRTLKDTNQEKSDIAKTGESPKYGNRETASPFQGDDHAW